MTYHKSQIDFQIDVPEGEQQLTDNFMIIYVTTQIYRQQLDDLFHFFSIDRRVLICGLWSSDTIR